MNKQLEKCLEAEEKYSDGLNRDIKSLLSIEPNNNFISKDKIKNEIFHYNKNALDIEQNNMFRPATSKEQIEIDINRAIAQAMQKLLKE